MDIATKLRKLRAQKGNTASELAKLLNVSSAAVSQWESGRQNPSKAKLIQLAKYYHVSLDFLLGNDTDNEDSNKSIVRFEPYKGKKIPISGENVADIPFSTPQEILVHEEIPAKCSNHGEFFGLRAQDTSMEPLIHVDDTVIIKQQHDYVDGNVCAVIIGTGNLSLKRIYKSEFGITLKAENKAEFQDKSYSIKEIEVLPVKIIGVAVEVRRKLI